MATGRGGMDESLDAVVAGMDEDIVRALLVVAAERFVDVDRMVRLAAVGPGDGVAALRVLVDDALRTRRFLGWRESTEWGISVQPVVDALEREVAMAPSRDLVVLIERAIGHVTKVILRADDSSGVIGDVVRDLLALHVVVCGKGVADPTALAKWMLKYSLDQQDFFNPDPVQYVDALGTKGMAIVRKGVAARLAEKPDEFAAQYLAQRLAVADDDVPEVIRLLGGDLSNAYYYTRLVEALREMHHDDLALEWGSRGVAETAGWQVAKLYDLVAELLVGPAGPDDAHEQAAAVLRLRQEQHGRMPTSTTYRQLREAASAMGQWDELRQPARDTLMAIDPRSLVDALLAEGDGEQAWVVATSGSALRPGDDRWAVLAQLREAEHPAEALRVYLQLVETALGTADKQAYKVAVKHLKAAKRAATQADLLPEFEVYVDDLYERNRRRPTLVEMLRKAGFVPG